MLGPSSGMTSHITDTIGSMDKWNFQNWHTDLTSRAGRIIGVLEPYSHFSNRTTSGVLILTRHKAAAQWIAQLFHQQKIIKKYWLVLEVTDHEREKSYAVIISGRLQLMYPLR